MNQMLKRTAAATIVALAAAAAAAQDSATSFAVPIDLSDVGVSEPFAMILTRSSSGGFAQCPNQIRRAPQELVHPQVVVGSLDAKSGLRCLPLQVGGCFCTGDPGILSTAIIISPSTMDKLRSVVPSATAARDEIQFSAKSETLEVIRLESR